MRSLFALLFATLTALAAPQRPNVVLILADDLGYSDLGCYGSEIATPHLDGLAKNGVRFTQFYNTARCWPSRGALLTGYYAQQIHRDALPGLGGGGPIPSPPREQPDRPPQRSASPMPWSRSLPSRALARFAQQPRA